MDLNLAEITAKKLLEKFGAGSHKPGSGSAMAFQAMLAAELIITVIDLTNEPQRRNKFRHDLPTLLDYKRKIKERILPRLEDLFYQDSDQFGKVIDTRRKRDQIKRSLKVSTVRDYRKSKSAAEKELEDATDLVLEIADFAVELAKHAKYVFKNGFKSARGDSGSAYSSCISVVDGCLTIAELNLLSFENLNVCETYDLRILKIKEEYEILYADSREVLKNLKVEYQRKLSFKHSIKEIEAKISSQKTIDTKFIELIARDFQNSLWLNTEEPDPFKILDPSKSLNYLGYEVLNEIGLDSFKDFDGIVETAGIIDNSKMLVRISDKFSKPTQKFTLAHELGHALFHKSKLILHRDRGLDFGVQSGKRTDVEVQADKFAAYFLMPSKLVIEVFTKIFKTDYLIINENMAFALISDGVQSLRKRYKDRRSFSRFLAATTIFNGVSNNSLSECFGVSIEAMAIRLEELNLFEY